MGELSSEIVKDVLLAGTGGAIAKAFQTWFPSKKERVDATKVYSETNVLNDAEQREKDKFLEQQLSNLEKRYTDAQAETNELRNSFKKLMIKFDELEIKYHDALSDLALTRIELAAYKP